MNAASSPRNVVIPETVEEINARSGSSSQRHGVGAGNSGERQKSTNSQPSVGSHSKEAAQVVHRLLGVDPHSATSQSQTVPVSRHTPQKSTSQKPIKVLSASDPRVAAELPSLRNNFPDGTQVHVAYPQGSPDYNINFDTQLSAGPVGTIIPDKIKLSDQPQLYREARGALGLHSPPYVPHQHSAGSSNPAAFSGDYVSGSRYGNQGEFSPWSTGVNKGSSTASSYGRQSNSPFSSSMRGSSFSPPFSGGRQSRSSGDRACSSYTTKETCPKFICFWHKARQECTSLNS